MSKLKQASMVTDIGNGPKCIEIYWKSYQVRTLYIIKPDNHVNAILMGFNDIDCSSICFKFRILPVFHVFELTAVAEEF